MKPATLKRLKRSARLNACLLATLVLAAIGSSTVSGQPDEPDQPGAGPGQETASDGPEPDRSDDGSTLPQEGEGETTPAGEEGRSEGDVDGTVTGASGEAEPGAVEPQETDKAAQAEETGSEPDRDPGVERRDHPTPDRPVYIEEEREAVRIRGNSVFLSFFGGVRFRRWRDLNRALGSNDYSAAGLVAPVFGFTAGGAIGRLRGDFLASGTGDDIEDGDGIEGRISTSDLGIRLGFDVVQQESFAIYPVLGYLVSSTRVTADTSEPQAYPILPDVAEYAEDGFSATSSTGLVDLGLGVRFTIPVFDGRPLSGPSIGLRLGYLLQVSGGEWRQDSVSDGRLSGPEADSGGMYLSLSLGWEWIWISTRR